MKKLSFLLTASESVDLVEKMKDLTRIKKQLEFVTETDRLKRVLRKTCPIGLERRENSAEHSWQVILTALFFHEHTNEPVDILKVIRMLAVHDVVEIDVGDTFHYDKEKHENLEAKELAAANRIFGLLPEDQYKEYLEIWTEFEARQTPEARYAAAIDRLMAFIMNSNNQGGTWLEYQLSLEQVLEKNSHIAEGSSNLWELVQIITTEANDKNYFAKAKETQVL